MILGLLLGCLLLLLIPLVRGETPFELGLDLAGGALVTYRPDFEDVPDDLAGLSERELLAFAKETLAGRLRLRFDTLPDVVVTGDERILVSLPGEHDQRRVLETLGQTYRLTFRQALATHDHPPENPRGWLRPYGGRWLDLGEELLAGEMAAIPAMDVFSLGRLLWEWMTRTSPTTSRTTRSSRTGRGTSSPASSQCSS